MYTNFLLFLVLFSSKFLNSNSFINRVKYFNSKIYNIQKSARTTLIFYILKLEQNKRILFNLYLDFIFMEVLKKWSNFNVELWDIQNREQQFWMVTKDFLCSKDINCICARLKVVTRVLYWIVFLSGDCVVRESWWSLIPPPIRVSNIISQ